MGKTCAGIVKILNFFDVVIDGDKRLRR